MGESAFFAGRLRPEAAALQLLPDLMVLGSAFLLTTADYPFGDVLFLCLGKRGYSLEF